MPSPSSPRLLTREALLNALEWSEESERVYRGCFKPLGFRKAQFSRLYPYAEVVKNEGDGYRTLCTQAREPRGRDVGGRGGGRDARPIA